MSANFRMLTICLGCPRAAETENAQVSPMMPTRGLPHTGALDFSFWKTVVHVRAIDETLVLTLQSGLHALCFVAQVRYRATAVGQSGPMTASGVAP
jgi:hypothetical protein